MRDVSADRYLITVSGVRLRTTTNDRAEALAIAAGMARWSDHFGKTISVLDRDPPAREVPSMFGGTRITNQPAVIWNHVAGRRR